MAKLKEVEEDDSDFVVYNLSPRLASVCTTLKCKDEVIRRMNEKREGDMWLVTKEIFSSGTPNPCPCPDHDGRRHFLLDR